MVENTGIFIRDHKTKSALFLLFKKASTSLKNLQFLWSYIVYFCRQDFQLYFCQNVIFNEFLRKVIQNVNMIMHYFRQNFSNFRKNTALISLKIKKCAAKRNDDILRNEGVGEENERHSSTKGTLSMLHLKKIST